MRRSAAPSTCPAAKRPRFQPPFATKTSPTPLSSSNRTNQGQPHPSESKEYHLKNELRSLLKAIQSNTTVSSHTSTSIPSKPIFLSNTQTKVCPKPIIQLSTSAAAESANVTKAAQTCTKPELKAHSPDLSAKQENGESAAGRSSGELSTSPVEGPSYYNVMWCKLSKKKHKTWEEDAVLIVNKTKVTLKDMEGKDIGGATGYRLSEVSGLTEGSTLIVGGKEVEILGEISADQWNSGRCFTGASSVTTTVSVNNFKSLSKKFVNPSLNGAAPFRGKSAVMQPLFDPCTPDALVMPRPHAKHQMAHNRDGAQVVDVVLDPRLSHHLRPHQREGVLFLYECVMGLREFNGEGVILADEMGLGKTLQCISLLWILLKQGPYGRVPVVKKALVVTPGSLVKNWEREFQKWLGPERLRVFAVSTENRLVEFLKTHLYPVLIISYEMFMRSQEILSRVKFDIVICDEGHRLKNSNSKTTLMLMSLPVRRRIVLTGTPIQNDLQEFYSIVEFCNPGVLGSYTAFQKVYEQPIVRSQQPEATPSEREVGQMRAKELRRLTALFCIRRTQEVNRSYLPPKVENVVFCQMSPLQLTIYHHLLGSKLIGSCLRRETDSSCHLECIGALRKVSNSPGLVVGVAKDVAETEEHLLMMNMRPSEIDSSLYHGVLELLPDNPSSPQHSGKLLVLADMLHCLHTNTREKIVVVSNFTQMLDIIQAHCEGCGYQLLRLDGSTPSNKRQSLVEQFNNRHSPETVFLLSSKAGGVGLNLIGASRLILYDVDWNPANDLQAMARVWRDGQTRRVHIYRLLTTGTIEEKIYQRQISKQGLGSVVDFKCEGVGRGSSVKFSLDDLRDLFTLREATLCDTHDLLCCCCSEEDGPRCVPKESQDSESPLMTELCKWNHYSRPINQTALCDDLLLQASSNITFVFESETSL